MKTFSITALAILLVASDATAQTTGNLAPAWPAACPAGQQGQKASNLAVPHIPSAARSKQAMSSLVGRPIYACKYPDGENLFSDGVDTSTGLPIPDDVIVHYFQPGDKLLIRKATTDMVLDKCNPTLPTVTVSLTVENPERKVSARVDLGDVLAVTLTPGSIMMGIVNDVSFTSRPVSSDPKIGMTDLEVFCMNRLPERTNTDALGDDQLVYLGGKLLVYVNKHNVVTNVQTSY
jgi:hypothetical protein